MATTSFQDFDLANADRDWDGDAADKRVRKWADAKDEPNQKYCDTHVWYDADNKDNFTAYKLLICDGRIQPVIATVDGFLGFESSSSRVSAGVFQPRRLRGRLFSSAAT